MFEASLDVANAKSELSHFANRTEALDQDGDIYRELITRLRNAQDAWASAEESYIAHKLSHKEPNGSSAVNVA